MLKLIFELFKISFATLKLYDLNKENIFLWDNNVRQINYRVNELIFKFLSKQKNKNHQILLNSINNLLNFHVRGRELKKFKKYTRFRFFLWSYSNYLTCLFHQFKNYVKNNLLIYNGQVNEQNIIMTFGFPSHAFNYHNLSTYSSSFIEFLFENKLIDNNSKLISIEEYVRPSLKQKVELDYEVNSFKRTIIKSTISYNRIFILPLVIFRDLFSFFKEYRSFNISVILYFLNKKSRFNALINFINNNKYKVSISKIYMLQNFEIDYFLIDKKIKNLISTFCYSQNNLDVNSNFINDIMSFKRIQKDDISLVFSEINHNLFSYHSISPINFYQPFNFFQNLRLIANNRYKINLNENKMFSYVNNCKYSNLGFEKVNVINLKEEEFNILINDNTSESLEKNFKIFVMGVFSGLEHFISNFNDEILSMSLKQKITFFYKGKYGDNRKSLQNILRSKKKYNCKLEILEPYAKYKLKHNKCFDLSINLPFTSTAYTFNEISKSSIFYLPERIYFEYKNLPHNLIIGKKNLMSLIVKLNKKK